MNIFISWSGNLSRKIAEELREWIPCVIQSAKPFVSSEDIRKGNRWYVDVSKKLDKYNFGIVCLTKDNLEAPWILFESGALSKSLSESSLCTLLIGDLQPKDVKPPLSSFQHTKLEKNDFYKLLSSVNDELDEEALTEKTLEKVFEKFWPELENKIDHIIENTSIDQEDVVERSEKDILEEVLDLTRSLAQNQGRRSTQELWESISGIANKNEPIETLVSNEKTVLKATDGHILSPNRAEFNHPVAVEVHPVSISQDGEKKLVNVSIKKGSVEINELQSPPVHRGVSIKILFFSEEDGGYWTIGFRFHKGLCFVETENVELEKEKKEELIGQTIWRD